MRKASEWVFNFVGDNLARLAAMMALQGHVKDDLACVDNEKTVLASFDKFILCENEVKEKREGYLRLL